MAMCNECGHDDDNDCMCTALMQQLREAGIPANRNTVDSQFSGGFGLPWCQVTVGECDIAPIEYDDYHQDGGQPIEIAGWAWRQHSERNILSSGWSELFPTAAEALQAAVRNVHD